ncbi:unnamed protein product [Brassica rapa subsp. trilocularis]
MVFGSWPHRCQCGTVPLSLLLGVIRWVVSSEGESRDLISSFLSIYVILFSPPTATFQVHMLWRHTCLVVSAKLACFLAVRFGDGSTGCLLGLGLGFKRFVVLCTCPDLVAVARPLALLWRQHGKSRHPRQQGEPHILVVFIKGREQ